MHTIDQYPLPNRRLKQTRGLCLAQDGLALHGSPDPAAACLHHQATWTTLPSPTELLTGSSATGSGTTAKDGLSKETEILHIENFTSSATTNTHISTRTTARTSHGDKGKRNGLVRAERRPEESRMAWKTTHDHRLYMEFVAQRIHGTNSQQLGYVHTYIPSYLSTDRSTEIQPLINFVQRIHF